MCAHGIKCYRKNPAHFTDEDHPADHPFLVQAAAENPPSAAAPPPPAQPMQATASLPTKRAREEDEADDNTVVAGASPAKATTSAEVSAPSPSSGGGSSSSSSHHAEPIVTAPARPALTSSSALAPYAGGAHERAAWLSRLSSSFLTSFGDDTFDLAELAAKENASQPSAAFAAAGVSLLAPFRLLFGELREADCLSDRGLYDPPEFQPLVRFDSGGGGGGGGGPGGAGGTTIGYWRDEPASAPLLLATSTPNSARQGPGVSIIPLDEPNLLTALHVLLKKASAASNLRSQPCARAAAV